MGFPAEFVVTLVEVVLEEELEVVVVGFVT